MYSNLKETSRLHVFTCECNFLSETKPNQLFSTQESEHLLNSTDELFNSTSIKLPEQATDLKSNFLIAV